MTTEEQLARKQAEAEKKAAQQRKEQGIEGEDDRNSKILAALDQKTAAVVTGRWRVLIFLYFHALA